MEKIKSHVSKHSKFCYWNKVVSKSITGLSFQVVITRRTWRFHVPSVPNPLSVHMALSCILRLFTRKERTLCVTSVVAVSPSSSAYKLTSNTFILELKELSLVSIAKKFSLVHAAGICMWKRRIRLCNAKHAATTLHLKSIYRIILAARLILRSWPRLLASTQCWLQPPHRQWCQQTKTTTLLAMQWECLPRHRYNAYN